MKNIRRFNFAALCLKYFPMKKFLFRLSALLPLFLLFQWVSASTDPWQEKIETALLEKVQGGGAVECIAILTEQADVSAAKKLRTKEQKGRYVFETLAATARKSQLRALRYLRDENIPHHAFYIVNAIYVKADLAVLEALAQMPEIGFIQSNPPGKVEETVPGNIGGEHIDGRSLNGIEWGISMINADQVWALGYTGQGVVVAGQDTGYDWEHPAIKEKYRGWDAATQTADHNYNWHDAIHELSPIHNDPEPLPENNPCGLSSPIPCDDGSHGTHTMGTMVGEDGDNLIGVAPGARWIGCRDMERGYGSPFTYLESFEWFLAPTDLNNENPDPSKAPHVINNSWYCPELEGCNPDNFEILRVAVDNLKLAGVVVVVSAGNSGSGCSSVDAPPAMFENSFSIGATASNDTIAGFSSRGPVLVDGSLRMKPDVSAPGVGVRSSVPNGNYASFSGTSMAGPHVVGLVALVISANPELAGQVDTIENIIRLTAVPKTIQQNCGDITGDLVPNNTYGFGRVDALAAVQAALGYTGPSAASEIGEGRVNLFPNPFRDNLTIQLPTTTQTSVVEVYDAMGSLKFSRHLNEGTLKLQMTYLPAGVYFYKITGGVNQVGKLIKEN